MDGNGQKGSAVEDDPQQADEADDAGLAQSELMAGMFEGGIDGRPQGDGGIEKDEYELDGSCKHSSMSVKLPKVY